MEIKLIIKTRNILIMTRDTLGVTLPQEGLKDGVYTVSTKMLSQIDGHVTNDAFVFGVGESAPLSSAAGEGRAGQGSAAKSAFDELSVPDAIARYPALVGQVIVVGARLRVAMVVETPR